MARARRGNIVLGVQHYDANDDSLRPGCDGRRNRQRREPPPTHVNIATGGTKRAATGARRQQQLQTRSRCDEWGWRVRETSWSQGLAFSRGTAESRDAAPQPDKNKRVNEKQLLSKKPSSSFFYSPEAHVRRLRPPYILPGDAHKRLLRSPVGRHIPFARCRRVEWSGEPSKGFCPWRLDAYSVSAGEGPPLPTEIAPSAPRA